jgi:hypothetical protein
MFYVLVFSLLAVVLVVAGLSTMSRRRRSLAAEEAHATYGGGSPTHSTPAAHGTHTDTAGRRNRKAKRAQSQHDRRKRH